VSLRGRWCRAMGIWESAFDLIFRSRIRTAFRGVSNRLTPTLVTTSTRSSRNATAAARLSSWHAVIGDPTYADAILDRLLTTPTASILPATAGVWRRPARARPLGTGRRPKRTLPVRLPRLPGGRFVPGFRGLSGP
jgi:hypothetical protein